VEAVGEAVAWSRWRRRSVVPTVVPKCGGEGWADGVVPRGGSEGNGDGGGGMFPTAVEERGPDISS
jgi:hypothetical protein